MGQLGFGVMTFQLFGSSEGYEKYVGRRIVEASLVKAGDKPSCGEAGDELRLKFEDGVEISLRDEGQSCCESRYVTCDDDLSKIVGGKLVKIEAKDAPNGESGYGEHEQCFIEVSTDECFVTLCTHNEHNGYYGGFALAIQELSPDVSQED